MFLCDHIAFEFKNIGQRLFGGEVKKVTNPQCNCGFCQRKLNPSRASHDEGLG